MTFAALLVLALEAARPPVVIVAPPKVARVAPGGRAEARVAVSVREGFHVQANPASAPYLIPLRLELQSTPVLRAGKPTYPRGAPYRLQGASSDLSTYAGDFEIRVPLSASKEAPEGRVRLEGALHYQACDDRICLRPSSEPVMVLVDVQPRPERPPERR